MAQMMTEIMMGSHRPEAGQLTMEEAEDAGSNPSDNATLGDIVVERLSRRDLVGGLLAVTAKIGRAHV